MKGKVFLTLLLVMLMLGGCGLLDSNSDGSTGGTGTGGDEAVVVDE